MVMEGGVPLGQDLLGYTSPGSKTLVPVTTALNLRAQQQEREVSRSTETFEFGGRRYVLLKNKGTIALENHQKEQATLRITLGTIGRVEKVSHGGTVVFNEEDRVNQRSTVTWEVTLGAGESANLSYDSSVYR
jgi:hypothetical protein